MAGTPALYERERDWEKVRIPGPIKEDILIYVSKYFNTFLNASISLQKLEIVILCVMQFNSAFPFFVVQEHCHDGNPTYQAEIRCLPRNRFL